VLPVDLTHKQLLLLASGDQLTDLPTMLKVLSAPDLKTLAKSFHIPVQGVTKPRLVEALLKKGQQSSIAAMFQPRRPAAPSMERTILDRSVSVFL